MTDPITRTTLPNGLQILLKEIHSAPIVSHWIWYRVGSRDETTGWTGLSHWVEHMQFKGTPQFPSLVLDKAISRQGGTWNAFTFFDWTAYFETLPAEKIDLGLRLEADRMINSKYDPGEVEAERTVILSEREGAENEPLYLLGEAVQNAAFRVHPYHHEILGDTADLRHISREELYQHYRTFYQPNNAVVTVAGDFKSAQMLKSLRTQFESIPSGPTPPRLQRPEPPPQGEHHLSVNGPGETDYLQIAYRAPAGSETDFLGMTVLNSLLAGPSSMSVFGSGGISNKTSRLYRALVEKELAVSVGGGLAATCDPYLYTFTITVHPDRKPEEVLAVFDAEMNRIQEKRPSRGEIARAVKQARALFAYGTESITNQAAWLGLAEMFATYDWFLGYLDNLAGVSPADVQAVAQSYLQSRKRIVGTYFATGKGTT